MKPEQLFLKDVIPSIALILSDFTNPENLHKQYTDNCNCPIAMAIKRLYPDIGDISVPGEGFIRIDRIKHITDADISFCRIESIYDELLLGAPSVTIEF